MIKQQIEADLKQAMLGGDKPLVEVLRVIRSVILNAEIASGSRDQGLDDQSIISLLQKEMKKRADAVELYAKADENERADKERYEQTVIQRYLPAMMDEAAVEAAVDEVVVELGGTIERSQMGQAIALTRQKTEGRADGALIARLIQKRIA